MLQIIFVQVHIRKPVHVSSVELVYHDIFWAFEQKLELVIKVLLYLDF